METLEQHLAKAKAHYPLPSMFVQYRLCCERIWSNRQIYGEKMTIIKSTTRSILEAQARINAMTRTFLHEGWGAISEESKSIVRLRAKLSASNEKLKVATKIFAEAVNYLWCHKGTLPELREEFARISKVEVDDIFGSTTTSRPTTTKEVPISRPALAKKGESLPSKSGPSLAHQRDNLTLVDHSCQTPSQPMPALSKATPIRHEVVFTPSRLTIDLTKLKYQLVPLYRVPATLSSLPTEILETIIYAVPISRTAFRTLNLVSTKCHRIVSSNGYRMHHIGRKPGAGIALYQGFHDWTKPSSWVRCFTSFHSHHEVDLVDFRSTKLYLINAYRFNKLSSHRGSLVSSMEYNSMSATMLLELIHHLTRCMKGPSPETLQAICSIIQTILPASVILLLRWTFYVFWLRIRRTGIPQACVPEGADYRRTYCKTPQPPQEGQNVPGILKQAFVTGLPLAETRMLFMVECAMLFGPASAMSPKLLNSWRGRFTGPFYWFLRDSSTQILFPSPLSRHLHTGEIIRFGVIGLAFNTRYDDLKLTTALAEPPIPCPPTWDKHIEGTMAEMSPEIAESIRAIEMVELGRRIREKWRIHNQAQRDAKEKAKKKAGVSRSGAS